MLAILKEIGPATDDTKIEVRGALWLPGYPDLRWSGKDSISPKLLPECLLSFFRYLRDPSNGSTPADPVDPAEMFRVRRDVLEKVKRESTADDKMPVKLQQKLHTLETWKFTSGMWLDICGADMRKIRDAIGDLLTEGRIPNKRVVRLDSAKWGLDRVWVRKNVAALGKRWGMDLRAHTTKAGVILERLG